MKTALLLRGVNVSGKNRLPMAEFRSLLTDLGLGHVATHLQSGNAVFDDPGIADLPAKIAAQMQQRFGFAPVMFLFPAPAHAAIAAACPFKTEAAADPTTVHVWYLSQPVKADLGPAFALAKAERLTQTDAALYLHAPDGVGRSALMAKLDRMLGPTTTARNWRTVQAIAALLGP